MEFLAMYRAGKIRNLNFWCYLRTVPGFEKIR